MLRFLLFAAFLALAQLAPISAQNPSTASKYCFIIRTYFGHGESHSGSLKRLLQNLVDQEGPDASRWTALLLVLDNRPFSDLRKIVRGFKDPRISVYAELIDPANEPKKGGAWVKGYHTKLYDLTDEAIRACPRSAEWVIVTNGDNAYDLKFLAEMATVPDAADVVAFDFYSRYQRPTANPCDRLAAEPGMPNCKHNGMSFCQTDLAANAMRLKKMITEDRRFGPLDKEGGSSANDGMMASLLRDEGWNVHHVDGGKCLVSHSPNPQHCAIKGTSVWDESVMFNSESFGGECITVDQASKKLAIHPDLYEIIAVNISYDPNSFSFGAAMPPNSVFQLQCLRHKGKEYWQQVNIYGRVCSAKEDLSSLPADLAPHPWDTYLPKEEHSTEL